MDHLATVRELALAIPARDARLIGAYRHELAHALTLRGWSVRRSVRPPPAARYSCGPLDMLATPPPPPIPDGDTGELPPPAYPPVLIAVAAHAISYRTRATLQVWSRHPHSGRIVIVLYATERDLIPEADTVLALGHAPRDRAARSAPLIGPTPATDTPRLAHAPGIHEARYQRQREALRLRRRAAGGRAGIRARAATTT